MAERETGVSARGIPVPAPAKRREYEMKDPASMLDFIKRGDTTQKKK